MLLTAVLTGCCKQYWESAVETTRNRERLKGFCVKPTAYTKGLKTDNKSPDQLIYRQQLISLKIIL